MKYIKMKARKEHESSSGGKIMKGDTYFLLSFVQKYEEGTAFWKEKFTQSELYRYKESLEKQKQEKKGFESFIKTLQEKYLVVDDLNMKTYPFCFSEFKYDYPTFRADKENDCIYIDTEERSMITDDPFPMYDTFKKTYKLVKKS